MEFKGTSGKWELTERKRCIEVLVKPHTYKSICTTTGNTKWQYDMLLISKAPEMLEMLKGLLDIDGSNVVEVFKYKVKVAQLIKQATEI